MKKLILTMALLAAPVLTTSVQAADLTPAPMMEPMAPSISGNSGWYFTGYAGVGSTFGKLKQLETMDAGGRFVLTDLGNSAFAGAGVGYKVNDWFRADLTGEYRANQNIKGQTRTAHTVLGPCGAACPANTIQTYDGNLGTSLFMANGYVDLGTWSGLTPYIGAGIGFARHSTTGFTMNSSTIYSGGGLYDADQAYMPNRASVKFAYALHAGVQYDINAHSKFFVGYRYLNMGSPSTGAIHCGCDQVYAPLKMKNVGSHDIRVGFNWFLPEQRQAPILMRKG